MIDARELRIGNLFWDEDKTPCYFAGAWERKDGWIQRDSANNTYKDIQMYPIPLTTEMEEDYLKNKADWVYRAFINNKPEYVHQLQNFHFIITGKELEIKV